VLTEEYVDDHRQLVVQSIDSKGAASECDVQVGDHLKSFAGQPMLCKLDLTLAMIDLEATEDLKLDFSRNGSLVPVTIPGDLVSRVAVAKPATTAATTAAQRIWDTLGVQVQSVSKPELLRTLGSSVSAYGGGLKVMRVRPLSLAASRSIQPGDILIGIHDWQTTSESDLDYVMQQPEMYRSARKFYIGRSGQIMEGEVQLASTRNTTSRRVNR
jgi:serine protease Do